MAKQQSNHVTNLTGNKLLNSNGVKLKPLLGLILGLVAWQLLAQPADEIGSAESTFIFVANTLENFRRTGRLYDEIGLDGSEYQDFIQLLQSSYQLFNKDFAPDSNFCNFYRDPRNGIMEIEERALLAFEYLPGLPARLQLYRSLDEQFQQEIQKSYGSAVFSRINRLKTELTSFESLPSRDLDAAERVSFADTACR